MNNRKIVIGLFVLAALIFGAAYFFSKNESSPDLMVDEVPSKPLVPESKNEIQKVPVAPEEKKETLSEELADAMAELPVASDLAQLDHEETHHTPSIVYEGGMLLGELIEKAQKNPARREETVKFLKSCAENHEVIPQLRAVCWNKLLTQINEWKIFVPISDADVPDDIKELAAKLN